MLHLVVSTDPAAQWFVASTLNALCFVSNGAKHVSKCVCVLVGVSEWEKTTREWERKEGSSACWVEGRIREHRSVWGTRLGPTHNALHLPVISHLNFNLWKVICSIWIIHHQSPPPALLSSSLFFLVPDFFFLFSCGLKLSEKKITQMSAVIMRRPPPL